MTTEVERNVERARALRAQAQRARAAAARAAAASRHMWDRAQKALDANKAIVRRAKQRTAKATEPTDL